MDILSLSLQSFFNSRVGSFIEIFIYAFSDASESHLLINTKVTQLIDLYSPGVMPVRRRKYFEKNEGLAKCISRVAQFYFDACDEGTVYPVFGGGAAGLSDDGAQVALS